jgi:hypothetical protein
VSNTVKITYRPKDYQVVCLEWNWPTVPESAREVAPVGKRKNGKGC